MSISPNSRCVAYVNGEEWYILGLERKEYAVIEITKGALEDKIYIVNGLDKPTADQKVGIE